MLSIPENSRPLAIEASEFFPSISYTDIPGLPEAAKKHIDQTVKAASEKLASAQTDLSSGDIKALLTALLCYGIGLDSKIEEVPEEDTARIAAMNKKLDAIDALCEYLDDQIA